jgi:TRAP-type C4-dicarboxylate transport system substrate-binding protein
MNKDSWDKLPDDVKQVMDDMRREQARWTGEYMDAHVAEAMLWSKEKYDVEVIDLPAEDQNKASETLEVMIDDWVKKATQYDFVGRDVVTDMLALKVNHETQLGD